MCRYVHNALHKAVQTKLSLLGRLMYCRGLHVTVVRVWEDVQRYSCAQSRVDEGN